MTTITPLRVLSAAVVALPVALALLPAAAGPAAAQVVERPAAPVLVIAHRGASSYQPEHTFPAYDLAIEQDADMLECDLQLTADDALVCVHDATVNRTARTAAGGSVSGRVDSYTLAQLRGLDWGRWRGTAYAGAQIVTLAEQLLCRVGRGSGWRVAP